MAQAFLDRTSEIMMDLETVWKFQILTGSHPLYFKYIIAYKTTAQENK